MYFKYLEEDLFDDEEEEDESIYDKDCYKRDARRAPRAEIDEMNLLSPLYEDKGFAFEGESRHGDNIKLGEQDVCLEYEKVKRKKSGEKIVESFDEEIRGENIKNLSTDYKKSRVKNGNIFDKNVLREDNERTTTREQACLQAKRRNYMSVNCVSFTYGDDDDDDVDDVTKLFENKRKWLRSLDKKISSSFEDVLKCEVDKNGGDNMLEKVPKDVLKGNFIRIETLLNDDDEEDVEDKDENENFIKTYTNPYKNTKTDGKLNGTSGTETNGNIMTKILEKIMKNAVLPKNHRKCLQVIK